MSGPIAVLPLYGITQSFKEWLFPPESLLTLAYSCSCVSPSSSPAATPCARFHLHSSLCTSSLSPCTVGLNPCSGLHPSTSPSHSRLPLFGATKPELLASRAAAPPQVSPITGHLHPGHLHPPCPPTELSTPKQSFQKF